MVLLYTTESPSGSTKAVLEITAFWWDTYGDVKLHVVEPGGFEVYGCSSDYLAVSIPSMIGFS